jgi:signal transduction histidine kinase
MRNRRARRSSVPLPIGPMTGNCGSTPREVWSIVLLPATALPGMTRMNLWPTLDLLLKIVHPEDRDFYETHHQLVHDESAGVEKVEYRILDRAGMCLDRAYLPSRIWGKKPIPGTPHEQPRYYTTQTGGKELQERNRTEKILTQTIHTMQLDIARDLHDTIGQNIGFLRMRLDHLSDSTTIKSADFVRAKDHDQGGKRVL